MINGVKAIIDGHKFRSGTEAKFYVLVKKLGFKPKYESKDEIIHYVIPETPARYFPDFIFTKKDGSKMYVEIKGVWTLEDRKKHLLLREQYPDKDIRLIFEKPGNKIKKNSKTTYGQWCTKMGLQWAGKTIPKEWLLEMAKGETL
jgi:predicted nuclease of restriction endonuclease-like RecB superfamily